MSEERTYVRANQILVARTDQAAEKIRGGVGSVPNHLFLSLCIILVDWAIFINQCNRSMAWDKEAINEFFGRKREKS